MGDTRYGLSIDEFIAIITNFGFEKVLEDKADGEDRDGVGWKRFLALPQYVKDALGYVPWYKWELEADNA